MVERIAADEEVPISLNRFRGNFKHVLETDINFPRPFDKKLIMIALWQKLMSFTSLATKTSAIIDMCHAKSNAIGFWHSWWGLLIFLTTVTSHEHHGVSSYLHSDCSLACVGAKIKETIKVRPLPSRNQFKIDQWIPQIRVNNVENIPISWHHGIRKIVCAWMAPAL